MILTIFLCYNDIITNFKYALINKTTNHLIDNNKYNDESEPKSQHLK